MNIENHQTQFNHEDWIKQFNRAAETIRQFFNELFKGIRVLSQKSLSEGWKDIRAVIPRLTVQDFIVASLISITGMIGAMVFMTGLGLFGYQALLWLQDGTWTEFPLFVVFNFLFENTALHQWMVQPESWIGLQKLFSWLLENIPLSMALMVPGFSLALFMAGVLVVISTYRFYQLRKRND